MAVSGEESSSSSTSAQKNGNSRSTHGRGGGAYYLAKTVQTGSVVLQVARGHLRTPSSNDVVFGKETSLELVIIDDDGTVQSICEQPIFGTIKDLVVLPWNHQYDAQSLRSQGKDVLIVISDSGKLSFLSFCNEMHRFFALKHIQLSSPGNARNQIGRMLAVDSTGCFIAASAYEEKLALFSVSVSAGSDIIDKTSFYPPESEGQSSSARGIASICGTIWSMCFISTDHCELSKDQKPLLAVLLNRRLSFYRNDLLLMEWNTRDNAVCVLSQYSDPGALAHHIVEVPHSYGFAILFRHGDALLMDLRDIHNPLPIYRVIFDFTPNVVVKHPHVSFVPDMMDEMYSVAASALLELRETHKSDDPMNLDSDSFIEPGANYVCSWSWGPEDDSNPRLIFSADCGELHMIEVCLDACGIKMILSECLHKGLPYKTLLWVEGGFVAAIVEMGDGMVLKFEEEKLVYRSPIQNVAPILDVSVVDDHEEKHDQMFACCGMAPEGSLRIIRSGISVDKLLKTAPIYQGITGTWTIKMKTCDPYHSFLVLSFVEETRVLSVGVSFSDVTDSVGFQPDVCTLACGLVADGLLVQIHQSAVRLCMPVAVAHPEGIPLSSPTCAAWSPGNMKLSVGAVGRNIILVGTSNPCFLIILGVRPLSTYHYEVYELLNVRMQNELSCISIPQKSLASGEKFMGRISEAAIPPGVDLNDAFVIGTHKPSLEVLSFAPDKGLQILAVGTISLTNTAGTSVSGCVPEDARLVLVDRLYVLSGLRNGMILRFEWPTSSSISSSESSGQPIFVNSCVVNSIVSSNAASPNNKVSLTRLSNLSEKIKDRFPVSLQLIAVRRIGITPAFLIPLSDSLDGDVVALSDRPWLLHTARHSLSYTSISFQPCTHATPVCSFECPKGILFVADNSLHLVEMVQSKRLNVQKFHLGGTPRKVLYHGESKMLIVMRTELNNDSCSSDVCCVDPLSGSLLSSFKFEPGEIGKCMELLKVGNEHVLVIGTSLSVGPAVMPSGEAERTKGRLIVLCLEHVQNSDAGSITFCSKVGSSSQRTSPFHEVGGYAAEQLSSSSLCSTPEDNSCEGMKLDEIEAWHLRLAYSTTWPGMVLAICPYLDRYFLASAGNSFYVCSLPHDSSQRVKRLAVARTRFMIMTLTSYFTRIAVGDCRDGVLFFSYQEDVKKLEQLYSDPVQRLVADCILLDVNTAVVSDRKGSIAVVSCSNHIEDNASPECNLMLSTSYYMGDIAMRIRKGSLSYKLPADDTLRGCEIAGAFSNLTQNSIMASTLLGSIVIFIPMTREEYELLEAVQARLMIHPLTAPVLGNDHNEFRSRESLAGVPKILDGDMLVQFLELTNMQQEAILALPLGSSNTITLNSKQPSSPITIHQVVRILERVHYALN